MAYLNWEDDLDTGIDVIDKQHRRIVDYINELHDAMEAGNQDAIGDVIAQLVDYTLTHFAFEESLMEKAGYDFIDAHKKVHEVFTKRVERYTERFKKGEDVSKQLLSDLRVWLFNHIRHDDNDYAESVLASMDDHDSWIGKSLKKLFG